MPRLTLVILLISVFIGCTEREQSIQKNDAKDELDAQDTIPKLSFQDSSWAYPQVFQASFEDGMKVRQQGLSFNFTKEKIGDIIVSSGKIIATDPVTLHDSEPFVHQFPNGTFPVELAVCEIETDERVGFVRIIFNDSPIEEWKFALTKDQIDIPIDGEEVYGFGVDAGIAVLMDLALQADLDSHFVPGIITWEKLFMDEFYKNYKPTWGYLNYRIDENNLVSFSTGYGDGFYSTFIGLDEEGDISQLLCDFGLIYWWNKKE